MPKFYVVKDIGGGFDGLVIETDDTITLPKQIDIYAKIMMPVLRIIDRDSIVGDRNVSLSLPHGAMMINLDYLTEIEDPGTAEFSSDNPYGKFLLQGTMMIGDDGLQVSYSQYEKALQVSVSELILGGGTSTRHTLLNQNYSKDFDKVKLAIEAVLKENGGEDPDDLIFKLKALKEAESNGQKEQG